MLNLLLFGPAEELYVSEKHGSDVDGDGSEQKPFKTPLKVFSRVFSAMIYYAIFCVLFQTFLIHISYMFSGTVVCGKGTFSSYLCGFAEGRRGV